VAIPGRSMTLRQASVDPASGMSFGVDPTVDVTAPTGSDAAVLDTSAAGPPISAASDPQFYDPNSPARFFSLSYYQDKIAAFQAAVIALDATAQHVADILTISSLDDQSRADLQAWQDAFAAKKWEIKAAALAINGVADTAQAVGFQIPNVTLPQQTLGIVFAPLAIAGLAAAIAAAAAIVAWSIQAIDNAQAATEQARARLAAIATLPVADQEKLIAGEQGIAQAKAVAEQGAGSTLGNLASILKWVAIGAALYFAYRAWQGWQKKSGGHSEAAAA
jgi:hypothetical protein